MKNFFFCALSLLFSQQLFSQKVFSVNYANQADVKVYVVKYENQADLKVYKVKYENQAGDNNGKWFFTQYENQAKKSIFFVPYENIFSPCNFCFASEFCFCEYARTSAFRSPTSFPVYFSFFLIL